MFINMSKGKAILEKIFFKHNNLIFNDELKMMKRRELYCSFYDISHVSYVFL
jgi:ferredoxin-fold anticodon binding domain-containing protein